MSFHSQKQRRAVMAKLSTNDARTINRLLSQPDTTVREVKISGKPHIERRVVRGNKIIIERVQLK